MVMETARTVYNLQGLSLGTLPTESFQFPKIVLYVSSLYGVFSHIPYFLFIKRNRKLRSIIYLFLISIFINWKKSRQMYLGTICPKIHFSHTKSPACFLSSRESAHSIREEWITSNVLTLFRLFKVFILRWHRKTVKREDGMVFNRENSKRIDSPFQNGNRRKYKIIGAEEIWNSVGQAMLSLRVWEYFLTPCPALKTIR